MEQNNEQSVPTVNLTTISLSKIRLNDKSEMSLLLQAASSIGFFYLDLRDDSTGEQVLADLPAIYGLIDTYFGQPCTLKINDARKDILPSQDLGWKGYGSTEMFEASQYEMISTGTSHLPQAFQEVGEQVLRFSAACNDACMVVIQSLAPDIVAHHRLDHPSDTGLKLITGPTLAKKEDMPENKHTDNGTLTLQFYNEWGLHAVSPDTGIWGFIPQVEGCAVINIANSLQQLSNGKFHSPEHRITQPFDGVRKRAYISYFLRPENEAVSETK